MDNETDILIHNQIRIPLSELEFRFATSSGPGGQHVNRSETKVILLFNVATSPSLSDISRQRLLTKLGSRIDKNGVLQIQSQGSRSQHKNRETAVRRFKQLLTEALKPQKKRRKTKPSRAAVERRLTKKKQQSRRKQDRGKKWRNEE
ncbi:MAG: aminoacyl-tRNA hydrolase [Chloroflexi bacterium]|nr:aminoacyl-tRNA hydrolase [Chloroflexota bacterium]